MRQSVMQSNLTVGELSPDMFARVDNEIYFSGVSKAQNVVIMPHGGLRRRPGLTKTKDSLLSGDGKIFAFEFSTVQDYIIHLSPNQFSVYKDGVLQTTVSADVPWSTVDEVKEVDVIQSGDVMVITHENYQPRLIQREGTDIDWSIVVVPLTNIPKYTFDTAEEDVWSATRGWPAVCTFYQSRLWFAGSTQKPNSVWASKINSFFDFDVGTAQADFGIFDTLDTEQYNKITNIFPGRSLMVFTTGSEFYNTSEIITPETSVWKRSTGYGSKRIRPTMIDGAVLFIDRVGRNLRSAVYEFQEDAFVAPSISVLSEHLITDIVNIDAVKGTNIDVSDFLYVVNKDGTVAVLNTLRHQGTEGWTQWTTQEGTAPGGFRDVTVVNDLIYFMVERSGEFHLEYLNEGTTTDHNTFATGTPPEVFNVIHNGENVVHNGENVIYTDVGTGAPVDTIELGHTVNMAALEYKVLLDNSVMEDITGDIGTITLERPAYDVEVGIDVKLIVKTMPMSVPTKTGPSRNSRMRVIRAMLNVNDTLGVYANMSYAPDRNFTVILDKAPEPFSGLKELYLLGYDRELILTIFQQDPLPFKLLSIGYELAIGDL